jgi:hypothetical protein
MLTPAGIYPRATHLPVLHGYLDQACNASRSSLGSIGFCSHNIYYLSDLATMQSPLAVFRLAPSHTVLDAGLDTSSALDGSMAAQRPWNPAHLQGKRCPYPPRSCSLGHGPNAMSQAGHLWNGGREGATRITHVRIWVLLQP